LNIEGLVPVLAVISTGLSVMEYKSPLFDAFRIRGTISEGTKIISGNK
jgi:hypothetical protein